MNLIDCLRMTPRRHLLAICRAHHWTCSSSVPKETLVTRLAQTLTNSVVQTTNALSSEEHAALHWLAAHDGRMPLHDFTHTFGPIRPHRPWRMDNPTHPWRHPVSTAEKLLYKGLIYLTPSDPQRRQPRYVILPTEFLTLIPADNPPADTEPAPQFPSASAPLTPSFDPLLDLALFLSYLQRADVRPLHGRWLSLRHLRALGPCLSPPYPCQDVRSELQAGRIAFIHYLAESLGLVLSVSNHLKPSPAALSWLGRPRSTQFQALRKAWLSPTDDNCQLWKRYRLPGCTLRDPPGFARRLTCLLRTIPHHTWFSLAQLIQSPYLALDELIPWWEREQRDATRDLLQETLEGPLSWLGVVESQDSDSPQAKWRLTSLGAWLLGQPEASPPQDDAQPLTLTKDLTLRSSSPPQLAGLLALAEWSDMGPGPQLRLTPSSVTRALERGGEVQDLFATLARYASPPLTPAQRATLQSWAEEATPLTLCPTVLLEAADADQMNELWDKRDIRSHLGRQLTPKLATVQTPDPQALLNALRRYGFPVRSLAPLLPCSSAPLSPGDAMWLTVAYLVHAHLARRLNLTSIPPATVLARLISLLGPAELAAAHSVAAEAIAGLHQALDGPAPLAIPQDELLARLEAAIQTGKPLCIRYWSASRGESTDRIIQPERIEWRGDHLCLVAHCHLRGAKRTFRLDRIIKISMSNS